MTDPSASASDWATRLRARARAEGFADLKITTPEALAPAAAERLRAFVAAGRHGEMAWMADRIDQRADPRALWGDVRAIALVAEPYGFGADPLAALSRPERATISVYAQNRDYHDVAKKRLKRLARWFAERSGAQVKVFVDTAPVMEKPLAEAAGLGWIGKHTNLVSREAGSWFFLGALFTDMDLPADAPHVDRCGACRRCLDICPTAAFPAPYQLDARRCLSYLTIELKGPIPRAFRAPMGNRIYGCDDCLAVCPWNKFAQLAAESAYWARVELQTPMLDELAALEGSDFRAVFSGSPIKRIGRDRFLRNVLIAIGNSGAPGLARTAAERLDDPSPLVRGAAIWALWRLDPDRWAEERAARAPQEPDATVRAEWTPPVNPARPDPAPSAAD